METTRDWLWRQGMRNGAMRDGRAFDETSARIHILGGILILLVYDEECTESEHVFCRCQVKLGIDVARITVPNVRLPAAGGIRVLSRK